jgi:hypothetical protein
MTNSLQGENVQVRIIRAIVNVLLYTGHAVQHSSSWRVIFIRTVL